MIGHARMVMTDPSCNDVVGIFSVEANGWVKKWYDDNPDYVEAMYPPTSVLVLAFNQGGDADASSRKRSDQK